MGYRIKNTKTGQLGRTIYPTLGTARASARDHTSVHGVKCIAVRENGQSVRGPNRPRDTFAAHVSLWNGKSV